MHALQMIGREALGLFVADARFTVALVAWAAIAAAIPGMLPRSPIAGALFLFAGFAVILIENLFHFALNERNRQ